MKRFFKFIPFLLVLSMILMLAGCGSNRNAIDNDPESSIANSSAKNNDENQSVTPATGKSLVVYFSWSGNTQQMAQWIADESKSDIYRVTPKEAYGEDFESCADRAKNELDNGIRPELSNLMDAETMANYDTIYVGFPIWWYDLPMPMTAFLEKYDLSGKTIIPFFSHNGSSSGASSPDTIVKICPNSTVRTDDALSISGSSVEKSETEIREWVNKLNK